MQNREAEIAFGSVRSRAAKAHFDSFHEWTSKLVQSGNRFRASGQHFDQMGSKYPHNHTLFGQIKVAYIKYLSPRSEKSRRLKSLWDTMSTGSRACSY